MLQAEAAATGEHERIVLVDVCLARARAEEADGAVEQGAIAVALIGPDLALEGGEGELAARATMGARGMAIAGGTSEIARNQIAERILGMPRDPLIK